MDLAGGAEPTHTALLCLLFIHRGRAVRPSESPHSATREVSAADKHIIILITDALRLLPAVISLSAF